MHSLGIMFCIYQVYERTMIVMLLIENNISLVNDIRNGWSGLSIVIILGNWRIIKGGIYVSEEKWKNYALLVQEWIVMLIFLYYVFFKLPIMPEITLCCNKASYQHGV